MYSAVLATLLATFAEIVAMAKFASDGAWVMAVLFEAVTVLTLIAALIFAGMYVADEVRACIKR